VSGDTRGVRRVAAWLVLFVVLWWLWQLVSGEWSRSEWITGAAAAAIAATLGEIARSRAGPAERASWHTIAALPPALGMVFVDFGIVVYALFTRRRGSFRAAHAADALPAYIATLSPNAYVVDERTTHHLVPNPKSQEPV
jgi:hypothetical protein